MGKKVAELNTLSDGKGITVGMTSDFFKLLHYCFFKSNVKS